MTANRKGDRRKDVFKGTQLNINFKLIFRVKYHV
jgi:hypothetical protein